MTDFSEVLISQWGIAGLFVAAAGYIIWDSYRQNTRNKRILEEKIIDISEKEAVDNQLSTLAEKVDALADSQLKFQKDVSQKIATIEDKMNGMTKDEELERLKSVTKIAPSIHTIIQNAIPTTKADHILVGLLHNGTKSITGIPFIRTTIIAEKYFPIKNPTDTELSGLYKNEDIMLHNKLPEAIIQNPYIDISITEDGHSEMENLDIITFRRMLQKNIKRIIFKAIRDSHNMVMGFLCAYSFDYDLDIDAIESTAETLEQMYHDVAE